MRIEIYANGNYIGVADECEHVFEQESYGKVGPPGGIREFGPSRQSMHFSGVQFIGETERYGIVDPNGEIYWCKDLAEAETIERFLEKCDDTDHDLIAQVEKPVRIVRHIGEEKE